MGSFAGAGDEARTRYLHLGKVALYRMSYTRVCSPCWDHIGIFAYSHEAAAPIIGIEMTPFPAISNHMVPPVGIEPTTRGFSVRCSTN